MADENTQATEGTTEQAAPAGQPAERTFTQEEVNRMVGDARQRERRKYEGYVDGESAKEAEERASKAEAELAKLKADAQRAEAVASAAKGSGIPLEVAQMLNGADADELLEQAKQLLKLMPVHPTRTDDGGGRATTVKKTNAERFASFFDAAIGNS